MITLKEMETRWSLLINILSCLTAIHQEEVYFTQQSLTWPNSVDSPPVDKYKDSETTSQFKIKKTILLHFKG